MTMTATQRARILSSLVAMMALMGAEAQTAPEVPRLVVSIMIDQLRSDYLEAFSPLYGERGFQRLMREGAVFTQAQYPYVHPDRSSAVASLYSGASPYEHGIIAERWLDRQTLQPVLSTDDAACQGLLTAEHASPSRLAVSTLTDELKVATDGRSLVYAIAPYRDAAVLSAGHAADGAFWINDQTGQWASSSYYGDYPQWALYYDQSQSIKSRIGSLTWRPVNELVGNFNYFVSGGTRDPFAHRFSGDRRYRELKASACVNDEVNLFAEHCLHSTQLGADAITDFLALTYYAGNYDHGTTDRYPIELQDTYVRLDQQLGHLIDAVEQRVGQGRALFVVTSTGYADQENQDLSRYRIPSGTFSMSRAQLLLNMYLIAVYGQGQYVEATMGNQLYLNLKLIESRALNQAEVLERSADFLMQLSGVRDVYTTQRLAMGVGTPGLSQWRNAYNPRTSGDILIQVAPGWTLVNENTGEQTLSRESYMGFPLYFLGCGITAQTIKTPVTVDHVAPTVAQFMRIRAPNGCSVAPIPGLR